MWCRHCQQDVPGVSAADVGTCCLRCGEPLEKPWPQRQIDEALELDDLVLTAATEPERAAAPPLVAELDAVEAPAATCARPLSETREASAAKSDFSFAAAAPLDAWAIEAKLREAERLLGVGPLAPGPEAGAGQELTLARLLDGLRFDPPHRAAVQTAASDTALAKTGRGPAPLRRAVLMWLSVGLGLAAFACGGSLLAFAYLEHRSDLWELGVPMTLTGQVGLLFALGLQLERIWMENRETVGKLADVDRQLEDLQQTTHLIGGPYFTATEAFYQHLSAGANPQTLLTDVKTQLDLLAVHLARPRSGR
ncbi:MAG: hypothetical protein K1X74_19210 [Pirellulales bacterium]|nr:hypothetical protein [Pirellulales bacterium]